MSHDIEDFGHGDDCDICQAARQRGPQWSDLMTKVEKALSYLKDASAFNSSTLDVHRSKIFQEFCADKYTSGCGFVTWCLRRALSILE